MVRLRQKRPLAAETGLPAHRADALGRSETRALAQARLALVTSRSTAALLSDYQVPAGRVRVVEPWAVPATLAAGSGSGTLRLLGVAALVPRKGHDLLFHALAVVRDCPWHLDCVGSLAGDPA